MIETATLHVKAPSITDPSDGYILFSDGAKISVVGGISTSIRIAYGNADARLSFRTTDVESAKEMFVGGDRIVGCNLYCGLGLDAATADVDMAGVVVEIAGK